MKIVKIAKKRDITSDDVRAFIVRFRPQLPGIGKYYNDPMFLKYTAKMLEVFSNASDFVSFSFQLRQWLDKDDYEKKRKKNNP
jgi:hypothetical protein